MRIAPFALVLRRLAAAALVGSVAIAACEDSVIGPTVECGPPEGDLFFIELHPEPSGTFADYQVNVGDSIQVTASLRRVDDTEPGFNPQQGWYCETTASSPVSGVVTLGTNDGELLRIHANGWIRGLHQGLAGVTASSTSPLAQRDFGVLIYSP
jgi:hypothetical protein